MYVLPYNVKNHNTAISLKAVANDTSLHPHPPYIHMYTHTHARTHTHTHTHTHTQLLHPNRGYQA